MTLTTIGVVRGVLTAILFAAFLALWIWAWSKRREAEFSAAARLPLDETDDPSSAAPSLSAAPPKSAADRAPHA